MRRLSGGMAPPGHGRLIARALRSIGLSGLADAAASIGLGRRRRVRRVRRL